jgi:enamine deaminase RidA (YjgF/YER057c/UK114 family)
MTEDRSAKAALPKQPVTLSAGARAELEALGMSLSGRVVEPAPSGVIPGEGLVIPKQPISAPEVLGEATDYPKPSSFTRGLRVEMHGATMLLLSGTASVDEDGNTLYPGDFAAQCLRTLRNVTRLLVAEKASWHDVVRTTCFLRDIDRDYDSFNRIRTLFMNAIGLDPLPASTGIQAHLCRTELLVEIEAIAFVPVGKER